MKKIIQDLSFAEIEELVLSLGEKKFRAKQLYEGLMQGKAISSCAMRKSWVKRCRTLISSFFPTGITTMATAWNTLCNATHMPRFIAIPLR